MIRTIGKVLLGLGALTSWAHADQLISDFEHGNGANLGTTQTGWWTAIWDVGKITLDPMSDANTPLKTADGSNGSRVVKLTYAFDPSALGADGRYSTGAMLAFVLNSSNDLSSCVAFQYDYKGAAHIFSFSDAADKETSKSMESAADWTTVTMDKSVFDQAIIGAATKMRLNLNGYAGYPAEKTGTLEVDNFKCIETVVPPPPISKYSAYVNQAGYNSADTKIITVLGTVTDPVTVVDASGKAVGSFAVGTTTNWDPSNQDVYRIDASAITTAGTYQVFAGDKAISAPFTVGDKAYEDLVRKSLRFFYFQRAGMALEAPYAGDWARPAGHANNQAFYHASTGHTGPFTQTEDSKKGWYDAGDYGRYMITSGISPATLLNLYAHFPEYLQGLDNNIPKGVHGEADILTEVRYNLDWMLTMQDQDGGVFHKYTSLFFAGTIMPDKDTADIYAIGKSTSATLNFAAVMAQASRIYAKTDPVYSIKLWHAAKSAYAWGWANRNDASKLYLDNPTDVTTGAYQDGSIVDELFWASAEMTLAAPYAEKAAYRANIKMPSASDIQVPGWANTYTLGLYSLAMSKEALKADAQALLVGLANTLEAKVKAGFGVPMDRDGEFYWGSNGEMANRGMVLLQAYYATQNAIYLKAAQSALDYLLGRNPLGRSFVSGVGTDSTKSPHHRPSQADNVVAPVPGMLAGGAHDGGADGRGTPENGCSKYIVKGAPAISYLDDACSYSTNEVDINWNAPLAYLAGALQALADGAAIPSAREADDDRHEETHHEADRGRHGRHHQEPKGRKSKSKSKWDKWERYMDRR
jgi:endoglucanase